MLCFLLYWQLARTKRFVNLYFKVHSIHLFRPRDTPNPVICLSQSRVSPTLYGLMSPWQGLYGEPEWNGHLRPGGSYRGSLAYPSRLTPRMRSDLGESRQ